VSEFFSVRTVSDALAGFRPPHRTSIGPAPIAEAVGRVPAADVAAPAPLPAAPPTQADVAESEVVRALGQIATLLQEMRAAQDTDQALRQRILDTLEQLRRDVDNAGKTLAALAGGGQLGNVIDLFKR